MVGKDEGGAIKTKAMEGYFEFVRGKFCRILRSWNRFFSTKLIDGTKIFLERLPYLEMLSVMRRERSSTGIGSRFPGCNRKASLATVSASSFLMAGFTKL